MIRSKPPPKREAFPGVPVRAVEEIRPHGHHFAHQWRLYFQPAEPLPGWRGSRSKARAGTRVRLRYGEMLHPDGRLMTENLRKARATTLHLARRPARRDAGRKLRFTFHGFQYVELTGYPGEPGLEAVTGIVLQSDTPAGQRVRMA